MRNAVTFAVALVCSALPPIARAASDVAPPSVYRCSGPHGAVLYQDFPCRDGVLVDIKPDAADPAAIRRLERAQAESDRQGALRHANEASEARRRDEIDRLRRTDAAQRYTSMEDSADASYITSYPLYLPIARPHVKPHEHRMRDERRRTVVERRVPAVIRRPHG
jgi:hypothetical protein